MSSRIFYSTRQFQTTGSYPGVVTFSESLDNVLGGCGVKLGTVTEIIGIPGAGKTQLCLQMCASVQVPEQLGGLNAEALFIDTESNLEGPRFREILRASLLECQNAMMEPLKITEDEAMKRVHHIKAIGLERYCSIMYTLPNYIKSFPNVKLIVIDSLGSPFEKSVTNLSAKQRNGVLCRHMTALQKVAVENQIAVVLANGTSELGDTWSRRCNLHLIVSIPSSKPENLRLAMVTRTNQMEYERGEIAKFRITSEGIRDCSESDMYQFHMSTRNYY